ncbi:glycosyltransferase family 2 protein [Akkermansiaceae bacterium]|nr:glycosyltransferase family 2 protein [Akkermansiaceae bacterium]
MSQNFDTVLVVPAWNEAKTIAQVIKSIAPFGKVVVVNDASNDGTGEIAREAGADVITHLENKGYDSALNSGFERAIEIGAEFIITFDADGQHEPDNLKFFQDKLRAGSQLIVGVRPSHPRLSEKMFGLLTTVLFGLKDPLCGLKGYTASLYKAAGVFDSIGSFGSQLAIFGFRNLDPEQVANHPITIQQRKDNSRLGSSIAANLKIFMAFLRVVKNLLSEMHCPQKDSTQKF